MSLKDVAVYVVIFLIFLNAVPALLIGSGVADNMGVDPALADAGVEDKQKQMKKTDISGGLAGTLFQLYQSVTGPVRAVMQIFFAGPLMFASLGIPIWLTDFVFAPQYLIVGGTIIYMLAGRML